MDSSVGGSCGVAAPSKLSGILLGFCVCVCVCVCVSGVAVADTHGTQGAKGGSSLATRGPIRRVVRPGPALPPAGRPPKQINEAPRRPDGSAAAIGCRHGNGALPFATVRKTRRNSTPMASPSNGSAADATRTGPVRHHIPVPPLSDDSEYVSAKLAASNRA